MSALSSSAKVVGCLAACGIAVVEYRLLRQTEPQPVVFVSENTVCVQNMSAWSVAHDVRVTITGRDPPTVIPILGVMKTHKLFPVEHATELEYKVTFQDPFFPYFRHTQQGTCTMYE